MLFYANILMVVSALAGMICIAHKVKWGFVIYFITELTFWYIGYTTANYGLCIAAVLYFTVNVYSFIMWSKAK